MVSNQRSKKNVKDKVWRCGDATVLTTDKILRVFTDTSKLRKYFLFTFTYLSVRNSRSHKNKIIPWGT